MSWKLDKLLNDVDPQDVLSFDPVVATMQNGDLVLCELAEIDEDNYCMMTLFSFFTSAVDRMLESMSASTGDADESTSKSNVLAFQPKGTTVH